MFRIGDVVRFKSADAGYVKFHLCVSLDGHFTYLNSPKSKSFVGDFEIDGALISGVPEHASGRSVISCTKAMQFDRGQLAGLDATKTGEVAKTVLRDLYFFVENLSTLTPETRDAILDGLGEWI